MRLSKIKLAGFKSFVDSTTIQLPSNLVGVVGPNGCGKSNVIDAIRWVMGETSARHLRGDSMEDVIFNGSSARKPVGAASIELYFDNSDGTIGGQFASYTEISIRRTVARDGTSQYFLNNTRCRRKDITGLFLGTGLGPRSYAIIEQGMVSRLVEAKPEDMRTYIEEAAGISKYKERRRETENRMHHTRENLARLNDLRDEVDKQIRHLQRQAQVAEKYRTLKQQERQLEAELLAIRLGDMERSLLLSRTELSSHQTTLESMVADQRHLESALESARARHVSASDAFATMQANYFAVQGEVSRLEQSIAHGRELKERFLRERQAAAGQLEVLDAEHLRDQERVTSLDAALLELEPQLVEGRQWEESASAELKEREASLTEWQDRWAAFNLEIKESQHRRQVAATRIEHLELGGERLKRQIESLEGERAIISGTGLEGRLEELLAAEAAAGEAVQATSTRLDAITRQLKEMRDTEQQQSSAMEQKLGALESRRSRLETLQAVQNAALGHDEAALGSWLTRRSLSAERKLAGQIQVAERWSRAVETVLGDFLEAICVADSSALAADLPDTNLALVMPGPAVSSAPDRLLAQVSEAGPLGDVLSQVHCADDLEAALRIRSDLQAGESVITPDGVWMGRGWLRISRGQRYAGTIARAQEIRQLVDQLAVEEHRVEALMVERTSIRARIESAEGERRHFQSRFDELNREHSSAITAVGALRQELGRIRDRLAIIGNDAGALAGELEGVAVGVAESHAVLSAATDHLVGLESQRDGLRAEQEGLLAAYNAVRETAESNRSRVSQLMIDVESRRTGRDAARQALLRLQSQRQQLAERISAVSVQLAEAEPELDALQHALDVELGRQLEVQAQLADGRHALELVEEALRADEATRLDVERKAAVEREQVDTLRMQVREIEVRQEAVQERFAATGLGLADVIQTVPENAVADDWDARLIQVRAGVERLGPINLAAIDEFAEQTERKTYLDAQFADLSSALEILEQAIRKIDRETRTRFQETFDNINIGLKRLFPRLFGGGHAYLSMEGDDLLAAGVTVMARPPGKRNSNIHLLSGGEKALTAVALIFSIFELNPAPFCLLDEVDAPLDEANVGRFCDIVREMSKTVQFVVITHNKTTMEMTSQLMGVTMNEPGVSRLVAVDIDEAVKMAAS
jgi:chromosome segregation protein